MNKEQPPTRTAEILIAICLMLAIVAILVTPKYETTSPSHQFFSTLQKYGLLLFFLCPLIALMEPNIKNLFSNKP